MWNVPCSEEVAIALLVHRTSCPIGRIVIWVADEHHACMTMRTRAIDVAGIAVMLGCGVIH